MTTTTTTAPTIVCPPWCAVDEGRHIAELPDWEGGCVHESTETTMPCQPQAGVVDGHRTRLSALTEPDSTPCEDGPLRVEIGGESYTPDQAEAFALHILELVRAAKA